MFTYPKTDLDRSEVVRSLLGGYWNEVYEGKDQVADIVDARINLWQDAVEVWNEAVNSKSRFTISPLKTKSWTYFSIIKGKGVATESSFGGGGSYGASAISYGATKGIAWALPDGIKGVSQIYNRISSPSASLFEGVDYTINKLTGQIVFVRDPFINSKFATRDVIVDGVTDQEMALWLYRPKIDQRSVQQIFGLPIGLDGESDEYYKNFVNTVYDSLILGMSYGRMASLFGHALHSPVSHEEETVERIHDVVRKVIITDKNVYQLPYKASASVSVGDSLIAGDSLSNALSIKELQRNTDITDISAITLPKGFIDNGFAYDLSFINENTTPTISTLNGATDFRFKVGGHPFDVDRFWDEVHSRGLAKGNTIAQGLDQRIEKFGEPDKESLPSIINPLRFLIDEIIPGSITLVTIKVEGIGVKLPRLDIVPDLLALGNGVLFIFEAPLAIDSSFDVQSSNESSYTGAEPLTEYDTFDLLNSVVTVKSISSQCS